jgi:hypothetical protein
MCVGGWNRKRGWEKNWGLKLGKAFTDDVLTFSVFVLMLPTLEELVPQYGLKAELL